MYFAFGVALATDAAQILMGPLGWTFADEIFDVIAMVLIVWALGFHPLLLPTFILELVPLVDMAPTWTACTAMVVMLRRREGPANAPPRTEASVIDVEATTTRVPPDGSRVDPRRPSPGSSN